MYLYVFYYDSFLVSILNDDICYSRFCLVGVSVYVYSSLTSSDTVLRLLLIESHYPNTPTHHHKRKMVRHKQF